MHHGIFVLHVATSLFLVLWLTNVVDLTALASHQNWLHVVSSILVWAWIVYYFVSFKRFYRLSSGKAVAYFLTATFLQNIVLLVIFLGLLVFSFFSL
jgi:hypothetical protein